MAQTDPRPFEVHVVDDDESARESLCALVRAHGYQTASSASAESFLASFDDRKGTCLLLDLRMTGMDGLALQRHLKTYKTYVPIIVITAHGDVPAAVRAIKDGAVDFIEKPVSEEQLLEAIQVARDLMVHRVSRTIPAEVVAARLSRLTERERQVLDQLVLGRLNKEIADHLGISQRTVEIHRSRIREKMEARGVADLVRMLN